MEKYIKIYHKQNVQLALSLAIMMFLPLFIVSLFYDELPEDTLISFFPFAIAIIMVGLASLCTIRFKKMIKAQENIYGVQFQDTDAKNLENTLFLSNDWLIWAGRYAFYKNHIQSIKEIRRRYQLGLTYYVVINTIDNKKYKIWCRSPSDIKKIKQWKKA